jgi:hypothetical protein
VEVLSHGVVWLFVGLGTLVDMRVLVRMGAVVDAPTGGMPCAHALHAVHANARASSLARDVRNGTSGVLRRIKICRDRGRVEMVMRIIFAAVVIFSMGNGQVGAEQLPSMFSKEGQHLLMGPLAQAGETAAEKPVARPIAKNKSDTISPRRAFLYSVLMPGVGEFMAGAKKRGAFFLGVEAAMLGLYFSWNGEGKDLEDKFRDVADEKWDPLNYLAWRGSTISRNSSITHALPCSSYVNDYLATGKFGGCDAADVQQYYELIGKYNQFSAGWVDLVRVDTGNPAQATKVDSVENFLSATRLDYEVKRDDSNKLLKRASALTGLIMVNHVISAIDAARVARSKAAGATVQQLERRTRFAFVMHEGNRRQVPMLMAYKPFH